MTAETRREYNRRWRAANPEKCAAYTKKYRAKDPAKHRTNQRQWLRTHARHVVEYHQKWRAQNREKVRNASRKWRTANPERQKLAGRNWRLNNLEHVRAQDRKRCATDPSYRLAKNLRVRLNDAIRKRATKKADSTMALTGCDLMFLLGYLEALFKPGMTWDNYGLVWEIDHRMPCASYDLTIEANQRACFHYSNLQPLFVGENRRKHAKILSDLQLQ